MKAGWGISPKHDDSVTRWVVLPVLSERWREALPLGGEGVAELWRQRLSVPEFPRPLFAVEGGGLGDMKDCFWQNTGTAEYEKEEEERVKWLFIGISEVGTVEVWSFS